MKIKHFDTFAGAGGFLLALLRAAGKENIESIGFSEIDNFAKQTYLKNFPGEKDWGDITKIDIESLPDFDLITGGFPCQDVSVAGKQNLDGGRTALVEYLLQILEIKKPKYFLFENVKGIYGKKFETFLWSIKKRINEAGYNLNIDILNAKDFGLPQNRDRVFFIGQKFDVRGFLYDSPTKQELNVSLEDLLEKEIEECFLLSKKQYDSLSYESLQRIYSGIAPTLSTSQGGHRQPKVCVKIKNGTKAGFVEAYPGDGIDLGFIGSDTRRGRVKTKKAHTLTCKQIPGVMDKDYWIRKLTPLEYERLQGFPDGWTEGVSKTQRYKQMGNAIAVNVVEAIFRSMFNK